MDWTWLPPPKQEIINIEEDCGELSEHDADETAYLSKVVSEKDKSLEKRGREMNAQVLRQKVAAAAEEDKTTEGSAEVVNVGNVQNFNQSSAVNVKAESELVRDKNLPFVKSSYMWKEFDSQEVFRMLPQTPHFRQLSHCHEETREGLAIGHMMNFAFVVEKVSKLQIEDPTSLFVKYLEALNILEEFGFEVKAVVDRVNNLLSLKTRQEQFHDQSERHQSLVVKSDEKKAKLEEENIAIDKTISKLEAKRAENASQLVKEDSTRDFLQFRASAIEDFMLDMKQEFKVKSAAPWQRLV
ncbi:protein of unknown function 724 7 [Euphorbia peplus]|nr:protein of unknown function 724 7 [Euphorbia peplus]